MRVVVQRVKYATCTVDGKLTGKCDKGFMLLIGFKEGDTAEDMDKVFKKVTGLRIFEDEAGKMNKSLTDVGGGILAISQFTLYADCHHGNRPSFINAMKFEEASSMYDEFCDRLVSAGFPTERGIFGADMKIELLNDGPVTILLDSEEL